jgi:hypothetical protein
MAKLVATKISLKIDATVEATEAFDTIIIVPVIPFLFDIGNFSFAERALYQRHSPLHTIS